MRETKMNKAISMSKLLPAVTLALALLFTATAHASAPGITGPTFNLTAQTAYLTQPDGQAIYSWGYGCNGAPSGYLPAAITNGSSKRVSTFKSSGCSAWSAASSFAACEI